MIRILLLTALLGLISSINGHKGDNALSKLHVENIVRSLDGGSIVIEANELHGVGQMINISWSGISTKIDAAGDWVGIWSPRPADGNYSAHSPTKYIKVKSDEKGAGRVELWILNMRAEVVAAYFTNGFDSPVVVAESKPVQFTDPNRPMHVHMALTGNPTEMVIDWTSAHDDSYKPFIRFGRDPRKLDRTAKVTTSTYTAADMCGAPATTVGFMDPGFFHTALLEGLEPHTEYFYQVGDSTRDSESVVYNFFAAPHPEARDVEFVIFGDLGQAERDGSNEGSEMVGSLQTTDCMKADLRDGVIKLNASSAVFHIGDISYARGYAAIWEQFFYQLSFAQPHMPWMVVDGNHERDWTFGGSMWNGTDSGGECGVAMENRFHMPVPARNKRPNDQTWWSVDFGPVHFTVMSTELDFTPGSLQYQWIANDWAKVDRKKTPFLILAGHRPMYIDSTNNSPNGGDTSVGQVLIDSLEPLMQKYQVDAAFWGHHHSYQRTCAVHSFTCVDETQGTIHLVVGAAGAGFSTNLYPQQPDWIKFVNDSTHGYMIGHVKDRKTLTLDFIHATERTVMDTVTIQSKFQDRVITASE